MAGKFEVFLDPESMFRFRLLGPDGAIMAVSEAFGDKAALVAGIAAVRECAGTGLVTDLCPATVHATKAQGSAPKAVPLAGDTGCGEQPAAPGLHDLARAGRLRRHVAAARWERRRDHAATAQ